MEKFGYEGRVLVLGAGSVSQCTVPIIADRFVKSASQITVIDYVDNRYRYQKLIDQGLKYEFGELTQENLPDLLSKYVSGDDLIIDLTTNVDALEALQWCHNHDVMYLNAGVEVWDPYLDAIKTPPPDRTLYSRHMKLRELKEALNKKGKTAIVEHGANPGLVSHWTKKALIDIATQTIKDGIANDAIKSALESENYPALAEALTVKVIHIAEIDTQITDQPKRVNEFVNTWSIDGFHEEGIAPAELGWGTHEKKLPRNGYEHESGPKNQICIAQPGADTWVRSWVPNSGEISGMLVRHGEAFTITDYLTTYNEDGSARYRPTVHYAYCPSDSAIVSFRELIARNWVLQDNLRIMNDEIIDGEDRLGVLLMGHPYKAWWTGCLTNIHETRTLAPGQNATTIQVAASILGAVAWMIKNPQEGINVPDDLPWRDILAVANDYVGELWSGAVDWTPVKNRTDVFEGWSDHVYDETDPWQFDNFLIN
jgi:homospermidine synthase